MQQARLYSSIRTASYCHPGSRGNMAGLGLSGGLSKHALRWVPQLAFAQSLPRATHPITAIAAPNGSHRDIKTNAAAPPVPASTLIRPGTAASFAASAVDGIPYTQLSVGAWWREHIGDACMSDGPVIVHARPCCGWALPSDALLVKISVNRGPGLQYLLTWAYQNNPSVPPCYLTNGTPKSGMVHHCTTP